MKTIEIPKPFEIIRHVPVEVEKPVIQKVPVVTVQKYTKEIPLPKIPLPSFPKVKDLWSHSQHSGDVQYEQHNESW